MAAPTPSTRTPPSISPMKDGFDTFITFEGNDTAALWEKTQGVTPPGFDGGPAISTDTMWNEQYMTKRARALKTMTEASATYAYDPSTLDDIEALINTETTVTVRFPDGSSWCFYGYLRVFKPNELREGEQPTAVGTIEVTNVDPETGEEAAPVYTGAA